MKKIIAFLTVVTLSIVLMVGAGANDKILKAHKAQGDKAKVAGKEMTCATCHNATKDAIVKKKGQGLNPVVKNAKGEVVEKVGANYAKTKANGVCKQCHK